MEVQFVARWNIIHGEISGKLKCNLLEGKNTSFEENFGKDENTNNMARWKYNLWQVEKQPVRGRKYIFVKMKIQFVAG